MGFKTFVSETLTSGDMNDLVMKQTNIRCLAASKPTGEEGMEIHVTDEDRSYLYNGSAWIRTANYSAAGRTGVVLTRAAAQTIPTTVLTTISWDTEGFDSDGFVAVPSGTITIPAGLGGLYVATVSTDWSAGTGGLGGLINIVRNGTTYGNTMPAGVQTGLSSITIPWAVGDALTVSVLHTASGSLTVTARLDFFRLSA